MTSLNPLFTTADFPVAELNALVLDGEAYRVDECFAPVDQPEDPRLRANALTRLYGSAGAFAAGSALWIHTGSPEPETHTVWIRHDERGRMPRTARLTVVESVHATRDARPVGAASVANPVRTIAELLRSGQVAAPAVRAACERLARRDGLTLSTMQRYVRSTARSPHTARAMRLIETLRFADASPAADAIHVVDAVDTPNRLQHPSEMGRVAHLEHETAHRQTVA